MSSDALRRAFLAEMPAEAAQRWAARVGLDERLAEACRVAAEAWPTLAIDALELSAHLGACSVDAEDIPLANVVSIALAHAVAAQREGAVALLLARHGDDIEAALRSSRLPADGIDDVRQHVLLKLLGPGGRLREYAGRGDLAGWLRVVTTREVLTWRRRRRDREVPVSDPIGEAGLAHDPELSFIKAGHRAALLTALRETIDALEPRERALLRDRFRDGLTLEQLAAVHGVHRASVARWLAHLREHLQVELRRRLAAHLGVDPVEIDGVIGWVRSRFDITLTGLLGGAPESAADD